MKTFIEAQFNYCTLVWMFCGRKANSKINNIHERSLRIVYSDYHSSFEELLQKVNSFNVHYKNIQSFAIELFKPFWYGIGDIMAASTLMFLNF